MKKIISTALFVSVLLFTAQNVDAQSETREVGPFDGVHIAGPYEVTLTSGKEGTISLSGDDEDLENIESYIKKGKLIIKKKKNPGSAIGLQERLPFVFQLKKYLRSF